MKKYTYYTDDKVSLWHRTYYSIKAENKEEANKKAIEMLVKGNMFDVDSIDILDLEYLYDTEEPVDLDMNGGQATTELYSDENDELLYKNGE